MWVIKNKKYGNFYHSTINKNMKHFVSYIEEAKKMSKTQCNNIMKTFKNIENYEMIKVGKYV